MLAHSIAVLQGFLDQLTTVSVQLQGCTGLQCTWYGRNFSWSATDAESVPRLEFCMSGCTSLTSAQQLSPLAAAVPLLHAMTLPAAALLC